MYISSLINILLITAFIIDRIFRLKSISEYKLAKEAQIASLQQQLEIERKNNDIEITEMHKKRYESLKIILEEKEDQSNKNELALLELKFTLENLKEDSSLKESLVTKLIDELNRLELYKKNLELEKKALLKQIEESSNYPHYIPLRERVSKKL